MGIMDKAVGLVEVMSEIERTAFIEVLKSKGLLDTAVAVEEPKASGGGKRRGGKGGYWLKTVVGWDDSKKGAFRAIGDFVRQACDLSDGTLILLGWTGADDKKRYAVAEVSAGQEVEIATLSGMKTVKGVAISSVFETWKSFEEAAKDIGIGI